MGWPFPYPLSHTVYRPLPSYQTLDFDGAPTALLGDSPGSTALTSYPPSSAVCTGTLYVDGPKGRANRVDVVGHQIDYTSFSWPPCPLKQTANYELAAASWNLCLLVFFTVLHWIMEPSSQFEGGMRRLPTNRRRGAACERCNHHRTRYDGWIHAKYARSNVPRSSRLCRTPCLSEHHTKPAAVWKLEAVPN